MKKVVPLQIVSTGIRTVSNGSLEIPLPVKTVEFRCPIILERFSGDLSA